MSSISLAIVGCWGGESCCRAVERESLVGWVVLVLIIVFQGWSLEGVIVFLRGIVVCIYRVYRFFILSWILGMRLWVSSCALLMPAVWHGLTQDSHPIIRFPMTKYE